MIKNFLNNTKTSYILWLFTPVLILFLSAYFILWHNINTFEKAHYWLIQENFFIGMNALLNSVPSRFWSNLTHLGDATILIPILSIFIIKKPRVWVAILLASTIAGMFSLLGKNIFQIPRPAAVVDPENFIVIGELLTKHNSLPSGHTITIFAGIFVVLVTLFPTPRTKKDVSWMIFGFLFAGLVAVSRVAVGAHWPMDVLIGAMLGWIAGTLGGFCYLRLFNKAEDNIHSYASFFISFLLLLLSLITLSKIISDTVNSPIYLLSAFSGITSSCCILFNELKIIEQPFIWKQRLQVIYKKRYMKVNGDV